MKKIYFSAMCIGAMMMLQSCFVQEVSTTSLLSNASPLSTQ